MVVEQIGFGPEEILEGGRWGTLVEVGDTEGLCHAMASALNGATVDRAALRARAAEFSLERALVQYLALWMRSPVGTRTRRRR